MRIMPPTGSNWIVQLNFPQETTRRMLLHNMQMILLKHKTNSFLLRFLKPPLQKMFANYFHTKIKPGSPLTTPIKPSSQSTELNKTNASLWPSMFMQSRIIRITMPLARILMWLHSDHNVHSHNNSANNKDSTTLEIDAGDKAPTEATATTN